MKAITRFTKKNEINANLKFTWNLEEYKIAFSNRITRFISIYINDKEILTSKPLSLKTITEISNTDVFERVIFILSRERKFRDEHLKIVDLIKNIINY